jgi:hypothetical protein
MACEVYTTAPNGIILSGMVDPAKFTLAMQDLHFQLGLMSVRDPDNFDEPDAERRHFTRSPLTERSHYDEDTPLTFRCPKASQEEISEKVQLAFRAKFETASGVVQISQI